MLDLRAWPPDGLQGCHPCVTLSPGWDADAVAIAVAAAAAAALLSLLLPACLVYCCTAVNNFLPLLWHTKTRTRTKGTTTPGSSRQPQPDRTLSVRLHHNHLEPNCPLRQNELWRCCAADQPNLTAHCCCCELPLPPYCSTFKLLIVVSAGLFIGWPKPEEFTPHEILLAGWVPTTRNGTEVIPPPDFSAVVGVGPAPRTAKWFQAGW